MSMETPLHRVQGLGAAHSGVKHFWRQRVTAAALVPLSIWFAWAVLGLVGGSEASVLTFVSQSLHGPVAIPLNAILARRLHRHPALPHGARPADGGR